MPVEGSGVVEAQCIHTPRVAVGLKLRTHASALRAGLARVVGTEHALQVLDVVAPLVGDHVLLCEHGVRGTVLSHHLVKETEIQVHRRVTRAVEGTHRARRRTTCS